MTMKPIVPILKLIKAAPAMKHITIADDSVAKALVPYASGLNTLLILCMPQHYISSGSA